MSFKGLALWLDEGDIPTPWPMRRSAIGCKSSDGGEESGQRIYVFDRRIRAEGKSCTIIDNIAESVEQLDTFLALRAEDKRHGMTMKAMDKPVDPRQSACR